jgi:hypothetical protein
MGGYPPQLAGRLGLKLQQWRQMHAEQAELGEELAPVFAATVSDNAVSDNETGISIRYVREWDIEKDTFRPHLQP